MVSTISGGGTPKSFLDAQRPLVMTDADQIFKLVAFANGSSSGETLGIVSTLSQIMQETKGTDFEDVWGKVESRLNRRQSLPVKAKTDEAKVNTALSLFYSALNQLDQVAVSTDEIQAFKSLFDETFLHVSNRFLGKMDGVDQRNLLRVTKTIEGRLGDVIERFNEMVDEGVALGNKILV